MSKSAVLRFNPPRQVDKKAAKYSKVPKDAREYARKWSEHATSESKHLGLRTELVNIFESCGQDVRFKTRGKGMKCQKRQFDIALYYQIFKVKYGL